MVCPAPYDDFGFPTVLFERGWSDGWFRYGKSFLQLRTRGAGLRLRTTFADKDSSSRTCKVASCEHHAHVLSSYSDEELRAVLEVALGVRCWVDSQVLCSIRPSHPSSHPPTHRPTIHHPMVATSEGQTTA